MENFETAQTFKKETGTEISFPPISETSLTKVLRWACPWRSSWLLPWEEGLERKRSVCSKKSGLIALDQSCFFCLFMKVETFCCRRRGKNLVAAHNCRQRKLNEVEVSNWDIWDIWEIWDIWDGDHIHRKLNNQQELTMRVRKARLQNEQILRRHQDLLKEKVDYVNIYIVYNTLSSWQCQVGSSCLLNQTHHVALRPILAKNPNNWSSTWILTMNLKLNFLHLPFFTIP